LHGSDICRDAIRWNQRHLPFAQFACNAFSPPLPYDAASFDLIFALSVFTHLDGPLQEVWLDELRRVAMPGAILLISTHGDLAFEQFRSGALAASADLLARLQGHSDLARQGMIFEPYEPGGHYGLAFHDAAYVRTHWERGWRIRDFVPRGGDGWQDVVLLEKENPSSEKV
jgi:SAM-dependent methyltransferase